jgi:hypothetical protein
MSLSFEESLVILLMALSRERFASDAIAAEQRARRGRAYR